MAALEALVQGEDTAAQKRNLNGRKISPDRRAASAGLTPRPLAADRLGNVARIFIALRHSSRSHFSPLYESLGRPWGLGVHRPDHRPFERSCQTYLPHAEHALLLRIIYTRNYRRDRRPPGVGTRSLLELKATALARK
jgi:hypothetical protein